jgi:Heterokaryon incompatibility protein (HET)
MDPHSRAQDTSLLARHEARQGSLQPNPEVQALQTALTRQPLYLPLLEAQIIRLIELAPGTENDVVVLRLFVAELEHCPEYEAISYVWGDPEDTMPIVCNGRRLDITVNLHAALKRVRHNDRPRTLWADAICINQGNLKERSHHVSFMGRIYGHAKKVLVILGPALDGEAESVAALVKENAELVSKYDSIMNMPLLALDDPLFDDPRWKALATVAKHVWFTRAWVLQETGLAKDPCVLYGGVEFSYRDLMRLAVWVMRCAPNLTPRASVDFYSIHTDWLDWSPDWQKTAAYPDETFLDLLCHARWLACRNHRDHIYAFLGHPLAQGYNADATIVTPDYTRPPSDVYLELAKQLVQKHGLRTIAAVEHDDQTLTSDFPSWVPLYSDVQDVMCSFGVFTGFYYETSASAPSHTPTLIEPNLLSVRGITIDTISRTYTFTASDLADLSTSVPIQDDTLSHFFSIVQDTGIPFAYAMEDRLKALVLTLTAGLTTYNPAESNLPQHLANFAAYASLRFHDQQRAEQFQASIQGFLASLEELTKATERLKSDPEKFWLDMRLVCEGRSFVFTSNGRFGLGPRMAREGDAVVVLWGGNVPFVLRTKEMDEDGDGREDAERWKLVGEAYVHGIMRGEGMEILKSGMVEEREFVIL